MRGLSKRRRAAFPSLLLSTALALLCLLRGPADAAAQPAAGTMERGTPIVLVVLEELPLSSLQKADGDIDEIWYPAFADLAAHSTWVLGHSSMANRNLDAVPAILSGRIPSDTRLWPVYSAYPNNLFTLLAPTHVMHVVETYTRLEPPRDPAKRDPKSWGGGEDPQISEVRLLHKDGERTLDEPDVFRLFVRRIRRDHARARNGQGSFHFVHIMFPMSPWRFTPSGTYFFPNRHYGNFGTMWTDEPWWPEEAFRRHLLQLRFTDRLLGELLEELRKWGLYDESLLIVTSSRGAGFWPGDSMLYANRMTHPADALAVPLFIKLPGQKEPKRIRRDSEAMDLLPTIADLIDLDVPFPVDGCSIFDESCPPRTKRSVLVLDEDNHRYVEQFPMDAVDDRASLDRRIAHFGTGASPERFYRFGPYAAICGKAPDAFAAAPPAGRVRSHRRGTAWKKGASGPRFEGILRLDDPPPEGAPPPQLALALNGRIETVVPAPLDRRKRRILTAMLPEEILSPKGDRLEVFLVTGDPAAPRLAPIALE